MQVTKFEQFARLVAENIPFDGPEAVEDLHILKAFYRYLFEKLVKGDGNATG